ncbi:pilus assembly protein CpaE [Kerstersia similis]|uniref:pilus assembly protein CpaE n=1 Tax=Kerstersia similis TaxID=206505 RepID=UPI0039EFA17D
MIGVAEHDHAADGLPALLLCSADAGLAHELERLLAGQGVIRRVAPDAAALEAAVQAAPPVAAPQLLFLDFLAAQQEGTAAALAQLAGNRWPGVPRVALGSVDAPGCAIAALRAGVSDFVDPGNAVELRQVTERLLKQASFVRQAPAVMPRSGRLVLVLGSRPGVGCSTVAVHWAGLLQQNLWREACLARGSGKAGVLTQEQVLGLPTEQRVALLDMGWPLNDALLYAGQHGSFDFAEAASNLHRLDRTLLDSALALDRRGVALLPLPRKPERMAHVSAEDSLALVRRLMELFGYLIVDAGGLGNLDFLAELVHLADEVCVMADQGVSALVALHDLLADLEQRGAPVSERMSLLLNRYGERNGLEAEPIAKRFRLRLRGALPERTAPLMLAQGQGLLLDETEPRDPWMQAFRKAVLPADAAGQQEGAGIWQRLSGWKAGMRGKNTARPLGTGNMGRAES